MSRDKSQPIGWSDKYHNSPFHSFYGWNHSEILWACGMAPLEHEVWYDSPAMIEEYLIERALSALIYSKKKTFFTKRLIKLCREYIQCLGECEDYYGPFWKGLNSVKNDFVFLQLLQRNIAHAWT